MSQLKNASEFITYLATNAKLQQHLQQLGHNVTLDTLVRMGNENGFEFDKANLKRAIGYHWGMRWQRYIG